MPIRRLPPNPDLEHLRRQARDLLKRCAAGNRGACQRVREFHPRFAGAADAAIAQSELTWSDALFAIAREHGFASWPRLKAHVEAPPAAVASLRERIEDPLLGAAIDAIDDGDAELLARLLAEHPDLVRRRARFEGENYFRTPTLLAFIAENPVRNDCLPPNIVDLARIILDAGATDLDETLALVASGRVAREAGWQTDLIVLLIGHGASPDQALGPALAHGEFAAAEALFTAGARTTLCAAAALGDAPAAARLLDRADAAERHLALALAAQHGRAEILRLLLDAGEDPNRYNPPGAHSHSTPLHQAAFNGHAAAVQALLDHGAATVIPDLLWNGTAIDWARHADRDSIVALLRREPPG